MTARNFSVQQVPYSCLLQVPDGSDFLTLEQSRPTEIHELMTPQYEEYNDQTNSIENPCTSSVYHQGMSQCSSSMEMEHVDGSTYNVPSRKRRASFNDTSDFEEDMGDGSKSIKTSGDNKKQNHSEIEKRRRDKMNTYITELSSMVPMCHAMSRKLDKLTVLRMAVQHIKSIRGAVHSYTEGHYKPSFLSEKELKHLILQVVDGFLFVVGCDRGRILYVSKSVSRALNYSQGDLLGQSWFDILHPKDVAKVKEQLSSSDSNPRERLIDAKTMLPVKADVPLGATRLCPGARRSFFCRMKYNVSSQIKEEADTTSCHKRKKHNTDKRYNVIHCTGYLKSWAPANMGLVNQEGEGDESCNLSCLVAIGRVLPHITQVEPQPTTLNKSSTKPIQFISRHATDGKFVFVDQRGTLVLGFLPQELLGTSMYEYYHHEEIQLLADCHKSVLQTGEKINTNVYKFRAKDGKYVHLQSEWKVFKNPWTKEIEYIIAKNNLILVDVGTVESSAGQVDGFQKSLEMLSQINDGEIQRMINSQVETSKIGCQVAEQVLDPHRCEGESSSSNSSPETLPLNTTFGNFLMDRQRPNEVQQENNRQIVTLNNVRNGYSVSNVTSDPVVGNRADDEIIEMMEGAVRESPGNGPTDDNDEAAMAVIMSLLEADAGLGGPVDFSGLPWPLP